MGGYSNKDINRTTVEVRFLTSRTAGIEPTRQYVMYRAAEIALERGYNAFRLINMSATATGGNYGYTSSAVATVGLLHLTDAEIMQLEKKNHYFVGSYYREEKYFAKDVMQVLEPHIQRN